MEEVITPRIEPMTKTEAKMFLMMKIIVSALFSGWKGNQRIHSLLITLKIGDKIWIQEDNTEEGIATDLERFGILKATSCLVSTA